jgi:hypothetical protein
MSTNTIELRAIAADVYVAPQLSPQAMAGVAQAGIKSVVNNRPDFEYGADQPRSCSVCAAAGRAAPPAAGVLPLGLALGTAVHGGCAGPRLGRSIGARQRVIREAAATRRYLESALLIAPGLPGFFLAGVQTPGAAF